MAFDLITYQGAKTAALPFKRILKVAACSAWYVMTNMVIGCLIARESGAVMTY